MKTNKKTILTIGNVKIYNPVFAITQEQLETGLMHVSNLPSAMVFLYKSGSKKKFWMKNTPQPLDVLFCNKNKIVSILAGKPFSEKLFGPDEETDMVIELPMGFCMLNKIMVGDKIKISYNEDDLVNIANS